MRRPMRRGPGLVGTMARTAVVAGTATAVVGGVKGHQQKKAKPESRQRVTYYGKNTGAVVDEFIFVNGSGCTQKNPE